MMKQRILFAFFALLAIGVHAQTPVLDSVLHRTARALQQGDEAGFLRLFPNRSQLMGIVKFTLSGLPEEKRREVDSSVQAQFGAMTDEQYRTQLHPQFAGSFQQVLQQGKTRGLDWSTATLKSFTVDTSAEKAPVPGVKQASGLMLLSTASGEWEVEYSNVLLAPELGGWFGIELDAVRKQGELNSATDSAAVRVDTMPPFRGDVGTPKKSMPRKAPVKKSPPSKTPVRKTTPANKPRS